MGQSTPFNTSTLDANTAVFEVLSKHRAGEIIWTVETLKRVRALCPQCTESDKALVDIIVLTPTSQDMGIHFDQV